MQAGLLLAETEYVKQVESDIAGYKGLLMGLFFMTVGMEISVGLFFSHLRTVLCAIALLIIGKVHFSRLSCCIKCAFSLRLCSVCHCRSFHPCGWCPKRLITLSCCRKCVHFSRLRTFLCAIAVLIIGKVCFSRLNSRTKCFPFLRLCTFLCATAALIIRKVCFSRLSSRTKCIPFLRLSSFLCATAVLIIGKVCSRLSFCTKCIPFSGPRSELCAIAVTIIGRVCPA